MEESSIDIVEFRLPAKTEFLALVRATAGVIGGGLSFNYDEIVELRTAAAEAFELAVRHTIHVKGRAAPANLIIRFTITPDMLEIIIPTGGDDTGTADFQERVESEALLGSLMDEVELNHETDEGPALRLVKFRRSPGG